jgi:F-box protein 21
MAITEWMKLKNGEAVPLERALAAFDLFVLHGRKGDFNEVRPKI